MKTVLFFLFLFAAVQQAGTQVVTPKISTAHALYLANRAKNQAVVKTGTVAQVRLDKVTIPGYGRNPMYFVEAVVEGKIQLLLLAADCPARAGDKIRIVEGHDVPRYVLVEGSGARWYCFMQRYLGK